MLSFLKVLIFLGALAIAIFLSIKINRKEERVDFRGFKRLIFGICVLIGAILFICAIGAVPAGNRGVVLRFGAVTGKVLNEGIYVVNPITQSVELMSVQVKAYEAEAASASRDLQEVSTKVTLNYSLEPGAVATVYQTLRQEYEVRIMKPAIQEAVKASTALFEAEKLITDRPLVKEKIENSLKERLSKHGINVEAVSITDFSFSAQFTKAIEEKVTATQLALKAERDLLRIKTEAEQKIASARAEAEALKLQKQQVTRELIELRRIEVQRLALEKWDGKLPVTLTGSAPVPIIDLFNQGK